MKNASEQYPLKDADPAKETSSKTKLHRRPGQFRISTLISWTTVVIIMLLSCGAESLYDDNGAISFSRDLRQISFMILIAGLFLFPALTCIPSLIDKLIDQRHGLEFGVLTDFWMTICVSLHSVISIMLATVAFLPEWKGEKGGAWYYYLLDDSAGLTLWPIYIVGAVLFAVGLWKPKYAKRSPAVLLGVLTNAAISFWYVFAVLFLNFASGPLGIVVVPAACGVCYAIYAALILKHQNFQPIFANFKALIVGWIAFLMASISLKIPLAIRFYEKLPDDRPEGCFVVTAATKGHPWFVGSWFDKPRSRTLNDQLVTFWNFESLLKKSLPRFHRGLRAVYNRIGPLVARQIRFRWQADLTYCLLKPLEWFARLCLKT